MIRTHHHHLCDISAKPAQLKSNHKETPDKPNMKGMLQSNGPITLKDGQVVKVK